MTAPFTVLEHPLAGDLLTQLRDRDTGPAEYRALTRRLGLLLIAEATRDLATEPRAIETQLEPFGNLASYGDFRARGTLATCRPIDLACQRPGGIDS